MAGHDWFPHFAAPGRPLSATTITSMQQLLSFIGREPGVRLSRERISEEIQHSLAKRDPMMRFHA
jgi:hypothetical protein